MAVHKTFIDAAAEPLRSNLENFFKALIGRNAWQPKTKPHMPDLWATLFLVVPVVSTTFASVTRMLGYLPPETLGWLLVDEAGQAVPQAAVGAIMRARRAVVVGDPLQIEPVTPLPTELAENHLRRFRHRPGAVERAQSLGAGGRRRLRHLRRRISADRRLRPRGLPLLVHRRCAEPMFGLSNDIAYQGLMVHATPGPGLRNPGRPRQVALGRRLRRTHRGQVVRRRGGRGRRHAAPPVRRRRPRPRPLRDQPVSHRRAEPPRTHHGIGGACRGGHRTRTAGRVERIGTVHTVQGREADSVILVLGAPLPAQRGARAGPAGRRTSSTLRRPGLRRTSTWSGPARLGAMPVCSVRLARNWPALPGIHELAGRQKG